MIFDAFSLGLTGTITSDSVGNLLNLVKRVDSFWGDSSLSLFHFLLDRNWVFRDYGT